MVKLEEVGAGDVVIYEGANDNQLGKHLVLDIAEEGIYLNSNYDNSPYFIIDRNNLDKIKLA